MFVEIRVTSKINEINGASESEEEINGDLARRAKLKKQLLRSRTIEEVQEESENEQQVLPMPHTPEISPAEPEASPEHWYSSGPENQTTPVVSPQHSSLEEKSEIEGESASEKFDGSSEGSTYSPPKKKKKKKCCKTNSTL